MGTGELEYLLEIEDVFGIAVADDAYGSIVTLQDMQDYIVNALLTEAEPGAGRSSAPVCPSIAPFLAIRKAIIEIVGVERHNVRPTTRLETVVPLERRRSVWALLSEKLENRVPRLTFPKVIGELLEAGLLASILIWFIVAIVTMFTAGIPLGVVVAIAVGFLLAGVCSVVHQPLHARYAVQFPNGVVTVADLIRRLPISQSRADWRWSAEHRPDMIWERMLTAVGDATGVERTELTPETRFLDLDWD